MANECWKTQGTLFFEEEMDMRWSSTRSSQLLFFVFFFKSYNNNNLHFPHVTSITIDSAHWMMIESFLIKNHSKQRAGYFKISIAQKLYLPYSNLRK
jgi:hypothetical protein